MKDGGCRKKLRDKDFLLKGTLWIKKAQRKED